ncbi:MAG: hypothetical protein AABY32_00035 [Nanoarchaeota archaeon]
MDKFLKSKVNSKFLVVYTGLAGLCKSKKIEVIDSDTFILNNRKLILDYHILTGDYNGMFGNLFRGKATLNELQLEEYQRKNFVRVNGTFSEEAYLFSDIH